VSQDTFQRRTVFKGITGVSNNDGSFVTNSEVRSETQEDHRGLFTSCFPIILLVY